MISYLKRKNKLRKVYIHLKKCETTKPTKTEQERELTYAI